MACAPKQVIMCLLLESLVKFSGGLTNGSGGLATGNI